MDVYMNWKVFNKLIDVKVSLVFYYVDMLEIYMQFFLRDLDNYCIILYVWLYENKFEVDEIWFYG